MLLQSASRVASRLSYSTALRRNAGVLSSMSMPTRSPPPFDSPFRILSSNFHSTPLALFEHRKPTIAEAKECPREFFEMDNEMIIKLSAEGIFEAM